MLIESPTPQSQSAFLLEFNFEDALAGPLITQNMPNRTAVWTDFASDPTHIHTNRQLYAEEAPILAAHLPDGANILELGAGSGIASLSLARAGMHIGKTFQIDAVDLIPPDSFEREKLNFQARENVVYHQSLLEDFPLNQANYHYIKADRVLPYLEPNQQLTLITKMLGSLKPQGGRMTFHIKEGQAGDYAGQTQHSLAPYQVEYISDLLRDSSVQIHRQPGDDEFTFYSVITHPSSYSVHSPPSS